MRASAALILTMVGVTLMYSSLENVSVVSTIAGFFGKTHG